MDFHNLEMPLENNGVAARPLAQLRAENPRDNNADEVEAASAGGDSRAAPPPRAIAELIEEPQQEGDGDNIGHELPAGRLDLEVSGQGPSTSRKRKHTAAAAAKDDQNEITYDMVKDLDMQKINDSLRVCPATGIRARSLFTVTSRPRPIARVGPLVRPALELRLQRLDNESQARGGPPFELQTLRLDRPDLLGNQPDPQRRRRLTLAEQHLVSAPRPAAPARDNHMQAAVPDFPALRNPRVEVTPAEQNPRGPALLASNILPQNFRRLNMISMPAAQLPALGTCRPFAMSNGTIQLLLRDGICVDISLDRAVRVLNRPQGVAMAMSSNSANAAFIHANGRVLQTENKVEVVAYDGLRNNNYVRRCKMYHRGISFTSEPRALIYLLDSAGVRTVRDNFTDLSIDWSMEVFYDGSRYGNRYVSEAQRLVDQADYRLQQDNTETYTINGFVIAQKPDGLVQILREDTESLLETHRSDSADAVLVTDDLYLSASCCRVRQHLYVNYGEKLLRFDGRSFMLTNGRDALGFNEDNLFVFH